MKTHTLKSELSFTDALNELIAGRCIGIRPDRGNNSGFVELKERTSPHSPDFFLRWANSTCANIRTNQYLDTWKLVVADHIALRPDLKKEEA